MTECNGEEALTNAEKACKDALAKIVGGRVYRFHNPGDPDCAVFDMGYMQTGDLALCDSKSYHFRAVLDLYRRDHDELQRAVMRLLLNLPVNADIRMDDDLREKSNVIVFRIAPEVQTVGQIVFADIQPVKDGKPIHCYTCPVRFDVVFAARFD